MRARIVQKKMILLYGLTEAEQQTVQTLTAPLSIACRFVADTQTDYTIGTLFENASLSPLSAKPLPGKFAVLDGFKDDAEDAIACINQSAKSVIKAMHTPYNHTWKFYDLCTHLVEEHAEMRAQRKPNA